MEKALSDTQKEILSLSNRNYILIERFGDLAIYELDKASSSQWQTYLVTVENHTRSPFTIDWNGSRLAKTHQHDRFSVYAQDAEKWAFKILQRHRPPNQIELARDSLTKIEVNPSPAALDLLIFDLDDTLVRKGDLEEFRGLDHCGNMPIEYLRALTSKFSQNPNRIVYSENFLLELKLTYPTLHFAIFTQSPSR